MFAEKRRTKKNKPTKNKIVTKKIPVFPQINGEDVRCASHEHVVDLIRSSGSLVTMTVVSQVFPNNFQQQQQVMFIQFQ